MLSFSHVCFTYRRSGDYVLNDVSFSIAQGQRVALLGVNGSGKSTLARLANGLLIPNEGTVSVDGLSTQDPTSLRELRQRCGVVAQDPDTQIVCTTVFEEVAFGPQNLKLTREEIVERVEAALAAVGLAGLRDRDPNTLSGGEKQRLVIAGVVAMRPSYVVFDEPTSMLDQKGCTEVLAVIQDLQRMGHGILHITHRLEEALEADKILVLDKGCILFEGTRQVFMEREDLIDQFCIKIPKKRIRHPNTPADDNGRIAQEAEHAGPPDKSETTLVLSEVGYTYSKGSSLEHEALKGIELAVSPGNVTLITGPTGSGKSTLLRIMAGLLEPTTGRAYLKTVCTNGIETDNAGEPGNAGRPASSENKLEPGMVGLVFQHPESQLFAATVYDDIAFGPRNLKRATTPQETEVLVREACMMVGLDYEGFSQRSPFTLSGGEARRCAMAGILAMKPQFLLLDEPTAGLDVQGHRFVAELIDSLAQKGVGVVVVSHDKAFYTPLAHEIVELEKGRIVGFYTAEASDKNLTHQDGRGSDSKGASGESAGGERAGGERAGSGGSNSEGAAWQ